MISPVCFGPAHLPRAIFEASIVKATRQVSRQSLSIPDYAKLSN